MRVPTITVYNQATYQLGRLTTDLNDANEVVSTNCRINTCSDDPSGMAQVLDINSSLCCLDQYQTNITQGQTTLSTAETALDGISDILLELELWCSQLSNASSSTEDRADAAENIQVYTDQLLDLMNTQCYAGYVFAGDNNQTAPFCYDDPDNPTCVTYSGSGDPACVKTGQDTVMTLDCCGSELFYEDRIVVDTTNNQIVFEEDPGTGTDDIITIEATLPSGTYTREELADIVADTMTGASGEAGCGITYEVDYDDTANVFSIGNDGSYDGVVATTLTAYHEETVLISDLTVSSSDSDSGDSEAEYANIEIEIANPDNLTEYTPEPAGTAPLTLTYTEDGTWTVENDPGYGLPNEIKGDGNSVELDVDDDGVADIVMDLNDTPETETSVSFEIVEGFENSSILPDLGFDDETVSLEPLSSSWAVAETFTVVEGENDTIDFTEVLLGEDASTGQLTAVIEPGTYTDAESYAAAVEAALEAASAESGNRVNYEVVYDEDNASFTIREDTDTGRQLDAFELLFSSGTHTESSAASDLGFSDTDINSGPVSGEEASWGIFDTLFDLEAALAADDVDGVQRAMVRLETHYESTVSSMAAVGVAYDSLTITEATASDWEMTLTSQLSDVQDADTVAAYIELETVQTVYEAALSSTSTVMGMSLVNYM